MSEEKQPRRDRRRPDLDTVYSINVDGSRNMLHPADVRGRWQVRKNVVWAVLVIVYVALPWLRVGGQPAVLVDIPGRYAYLFGLSFTNQDFWLLFFPLTAAGFALFVLTALWGRIWCGYACPQTVFMEGVFRRIERWLEGPRVERIRRNLGPPTLGKFARKAAKQVAFGILSGLIAHVFLSYFIPARELWSVVREGPAAHPSAFGWTLFWWILLWFDYGWFREQTCLIVCPYGRLQSALVDRDTVVIGYDARRGEPRSKGARLGGDCIDCFRCVEVCPTGIDIRNGLQMECIGCASCIDACDAVMEKVGKPRGLVRYDSQRGLEGEGRRPLLRPRVYLYALAGLVGLVVAGFAVGGRGDFEVHMIRPRGLPYVLEGERIRNLYTLKIQDKSDAPGTYLIAAEGSAGSGAAAGRLAFIIPQPVLRLGGLEEGETPLFAYLPREAWTGPFEFHVTVTDSAGGRAETVTATFRGP